jgi:HEAT repeat protein
MKSQSALSFLLEALNDHEPIVRNQTVMSIGDLGDPKALGPLLDIACQHSDVPASLLFKALGDCSFERSDLMDAIQQPCQEVTPERFFHESTQLRTPSLLEDLPEGDRDEVLAPILTQIQSPDPVVRIEATKSLAQYHVRISVNALSLRAQRDPEPAVRAQAISSLASIDHESVFPAILIGMADDSREVRAAAARSLSRLSFDRADAYVRLINSADDESLRQVASACIQAGVVSQGIDRLGSASRQVNNEHHKLCDDHRGSQANRTQAYETFAIISLLAKAKLIHSVVEVISSHPKIDVCQAAVRLLARMTDPEIHEELRKLSVQPGIDEEVRTVLLQEIYRIDQPQK